jgi:hypothetical protein
MKKNTSAALKFFPKSNKRCNCKKKVAWKNKKTASFYKKRFHTIFKSR